jgi:hypothetical protein
MEKTMYIHKMVVKKDAVRVNGADDIPAFLEDSIVLKEKQLVLTCVEGTETAPLGVVVGYEESSQTPTGFNCWVIGNAAENLDYIDGVFYTKKTVLQAQPIDDEFPEFLSGADIRHNEDGSWTIKTSWGESTGFPGKAYWVRYGTLADGSPDANILTKSEKSYQLFVVCDADGNDIGLLSEIDPA